MSWKVASLCAERKFGSPVRKQIIMFLADKASDDGSGIWCSKGTIQRHTELGESTVKRTINDFLTEGLLIEIGRRPCKNGYTMIYRLVLAVVNELDPVGSPDDEPLVGIGSTADGVRTEPGRGAALDGVRGPRRTPNLPETIPKPPSRASMSAEEEAEFEKAWAAYPEDRKRGKAACLAQFREARTAGVPLMAILDAVRMYAQQTSGFTRAKVCFADNWFRQDRWKALAEDARTKETEAAEHLESQLPQVAGWIRDRAFVCRHITAKQAHAVLARGMVTRAEIDNAGVAL